MAKIQLRSISQKNVQRTGTGSNHTFSCPKKLCTLVSSVTTFVNELILSPCNSVNLMFVKDSMTPQMDVFLNSCIIVSKQASPEHQLRTVLLLSIPMRENGRIWAVIVG